MTNGRPPAYLNWLPVYEKLIDNTVKKSKKNKIIENAPKQFIFSLEEIILNLQNYNIPLF